MRKISVCLGIIFVFSSCTLYDNYKSRDNVSYFRHLHASQYQHRNKTVTHRRKNWKTPGYNPSHSKTQVAKKTNAKDAVPSVDVNTWIYNYTHANGLPFPQSFIIPTTDLITFLTNSHAPYLHIYLGVNSVNGNQDLVLCGASENASKDGFSDIIPFANNVFGNFATPVTCTVTPDPIMEGNHGYSPYPGRGNANSSLIPILTARNEIAAYENQFNEFPLAQSFIINTVDFLPFLTNGNLQCNAAGTILGGGTVPFIQIYLAYDNNDTNLSSVIIVGLDAAGKHIYYAHQDSGTVLAYVFNTGFPCPYCNVDAGVLPPPSASII